MGIPEDEKLNLSEGWLTQLKERAGLKEMKCHSAAGSLTIETAEERK